jgi:hypothetical protein
MITLKNYVRFFSMLCILTLMLISTPLIVYANTLANVRIETPGNPILEPYDLDFTRFDLSTKDFDLENEPLALTVLHGIIKAVDDGVTDVDSDKHTDPANDGWICHVTGDSVSIDAILNYESGSNGNDTWMYFVNDEYKPTSVSGCNLDNHDRVALFFVDDYKTDLYAFFDKDASDTDVNSKKVTAVTGETVYLKLMGKTLKASDQYKMPLGSATINEYDGTAITPTVTTAANGRFSLTVNADIEISATETNAGYDIVQPYCYIEVSAAGGTVDKTVLSSVTDDAEALTQADYSTTTWTVLDSALSNANTVDNDGTATQAEVNSARNRLNAAMDDLMAKSDVDLYRLGISEGLELMPAFGPGVTSYTVSAGGDASIVITPAASNPDATITANNDSSLPKTVNLTPGSNTTITVVVSANGTSKTYTIVALSSSANSADDVYEHLPAAGQFTNEMSGGWGDPRNTATPSALKVLYGPAQSGVSLGAFGGYTTLQFNTPVPNHDDNTYGIDFIVYGNAFSGWEEPGGIMVATGKQDAGKLVPDTWYYIAGSQHYENSTEWGDYYVTYTKPNASNDNVPWVDSNSTNGYVYYNTYHPHHYYPLATNYQNTTESVLDDNASLKFYGVKLAIKNPAFGYCDVHGKGSSPYDTAVNPYLTTGSTRGDPIDIDWAVDINGDPVDLTEISFVKIYTGVLMTAGMFGEVSTEVTGLKTVDQASSGTIGQTSAPTVTVGGNAITVPNDMNTSAITTTHGTGITVAVGGGADNVYINNQRGTSRNFDIDNGAIQQVRIIVQTGTSKPYIFLLEIRGV